MVLLDQTESLQVISLESLIVDGALRATDRTELTFDEAVRLCVAAFDDADWERVGDEINRRDRLDPSLSLESTYGAVIARTRDLPG